MTATVESIKSLACKSGQFYNMHFCSAVNDMPAERGALYDLVCALMFLEMATSELHQALERADPKLAAQSALQEVLQP
jgi:hypothetical protein